MSLLRLYCSLRDPAEHCPWALIAAGQPARQGDSPLAALPRGGRVQLVIPATQTLITRTQLPHGLKRRPGSVLTYAAEEAILAEPEACQVSWLGMASEADVLAVIDKSGLERWLAGLSAAGIPACEVHSEILLLPLRHGEWSLAWDGREGFVRCGELEGAATDRGDSATPPLSLQLLLEEAQARGAAPAALALYPQNPDAQPDIASWQDRLGVPVRAAGPWDWRTAPQDAGVCLAEVRRRWHGYTDILPRLRPAAWIAGAALALHGFMLATDWAALASEHKTVRKEMEARFRSVFPDAVAVVDPALQMRRKLAEARHAANRPDDGDFLPMIEKAGAALQGLPAGTLRAVSYDSGRLTLALAAADETAVIRIVERLNRAGLLAELPGMAGRASGGTLTLIARAP